MNRLEKIEKARELKGISWGELSEKLPISGNSLRMAFDRGSVKDSYLEIIEKHLGVIPDNERFNIEPKEGLTHKERADYLDDIESKIAIRVTEELISRMQPLFEAAMIQSLDIREVKRELKKITKES